METKELFANQIMQILDQYAIQLPMVSNAEMPQPEFMAIVKKWQLSTKFLKIFLNKSDAAIQTYKYRKNLPITGEVAAKIRQLDIMLSGLRGPETAK